LQPPFEPVVGGRPVAVTAVILALVFSVQLAFQECGRAEYRRGRPPSMRPRLRRRMPHFEAWTARGEYVVSGSHGRRAKFKPDLALGGKGAVLVFMDLSKPHVEAFSSVVQKVKELPGRRAWTLAVVVQRALPSRALAKIDAGDRVKVILDPDYRVAARFDAWEFPAVAIVDGHGQYVDLLTHPGPDDLALIGSRLDDPYEPLANLPRPLPEFSLRTTARRVLSSKTLAGKPFVAVFVGRGKADAQLQVVRRVAELVPDAADVVLFVSPEFPARDGLREVARGAGFHVAVDSKGKRARQWGVKRFPAVALTDPSRTLVEVLVGVGPDCLDEYWTQRVLRASKLRAHIRPRVDGDSQAGLGLSAGRFVSVGGVRRLRSDGKRVVAETFAGDVLASDGSARFRIAKAPTTPERMPPSGGVQPEPDEKLRGVRYASARGRDGGAFTIVTGAKPTGWGRILLFDEAGKCVWRASTAPGLPRVAVLKSKTGDKIAVATPSGYLGWLHFSKRKSARGK